MSSWHCSGRELREIHVLGTMKSLAKMAREKISEITSQMLSAIAVVIVPILGLIVVPKMQEVAATVQIMVQMLIAILLWKMVVMMLELTVQIKSVVAHLGRSDFNSSCSGGRGTRFLDVSLLISRSSSKTS